MGWGERYRFQVDNTLNGNALTHYSVITPAIDTAALIAAGRMQALGQDIRFTDEDGVTLIPHVIELGINTANTRIWVKIPLILANTTKYVYMYFNNPLAADVSNGRLALDEWEDWEPYALGAVAVPSDNWNADKEATNPVLPIGIGETICSWASVLLDAGVYHMYYTRAAGGNYRIDHATSADGVAWVKDVANNPVLSVGGGGAWDANGIWSPVVWKENSTWYMLYTGKNAAGESQIGLARSIDGLVWIKEPLNPVLSGTVAWEMNAGLSLIESSGIIKVGNTYYNWYCNWATPTRRTGLATSIDLINWVKDGANPIFGGVGPNPFYKDSYYYLFIASIPNRLELWRCEAPEFHVADRECQRWNLYIGGGGAWDASFIETPCVLTTDVTRRTVPTGNQLYLYYGGQNAAAEWQVGLVRTNIVNIGHFHSFWQPSAGTTVVNAPTWQGTRGIQQLGVQTLDTRVGYEFIGRKITGVLGTWRRRDAGAGGVDIYFESDGNLRAVIGMDGGGLFHYWDGVFHNTAVAWAAGTWYLMEIEFNTGTGLFNFVVRDVNWVEIVRVNNIAFNGAPPYINRFIIWTEPPFAGNAYADNVRGRKFSVPEPVVTIA